LLLAGGGANSSGPQMRFQALMWPMAEVRKTTSVSLKAACSCA